MSRILIQRKQFVRFDGTDDAVSFASYTPNTSAFSIAFWFRPRTGNAANARVLDWQDAGPASGFTLTMSTANKPQVTFAADTAAPANIISIVSTQMKLAEWNLVTITYAPNSAKLYVNGVQQSSTDTNCTIVAPAAAFAIGKRATGATNFCRGDLHTFLVYPRVITQTEITDLYRLNSIPTTPDIYLKMDERSGTTVSDSSGNGRTGTLAGTPLFGTSPSERGIFQKYDKAINFSPATTSVVTVTDTAALRPETLKTFTWMQWVYLFNTRNNVLPRLIGKGAHYTCFMGDQTNAKANYVALETQNSTGGAVEFWGTTALKADRWYHIATSFNDGVCQHYIDGRPDAVTTILNPDPYLDLASTVGSDLLIGNSSGNSRNPLGLMQCVQIHNLVLTEEEIYQASKGGAVTRGLVAKYNMDEGTGVTVADSGGNGYDGTLTGGAWVTIDNSRATSGTRTTAGARTSI